MPPHKLFFFAKSSQIGVALACCICFLNGCEGPDSVVGEPRNSTSAATYYDYTDSNTPNGVNSDQNKSEIGFLYPDCFAVFRLKVGELVARPELSDVEWSELSRELANWVGESNSRLEDIKYAWIMFDRDQIQMGGEDQGLPFSIALEYKAKINTDEIQNAIESRAREDGAESSAPANFQIEPFGQNRILMGDAKIIKKMKSGKGANEIKRLVEQWAADRHASGAISFSPIRPALQSMFDMVASFSDEAKKFSDLPQAMRNIQISVDLDSAELAEIEFAVDNQKMVDEIALMINSSLQAQNNGGFSPMGMMGMGQDRKEVSMFESKLGDLAGEVLGQIKSDSLLSIEGREEQVYMKLMRPKKLNDLIKAATIDGQKQLAIMNRFSNFELISEALEKYHDKYDCLPPAGYVSESESQKSGAPAQLNWRVGLLPFLNEQATYDRFDFSKPWDSPENMEAAQDMPSVFGDSDEGKSSIHIVGAPDGFYAAADSKMSLERIKDRRIWTALVVEANAGQAKNWTEPFVLEGSAGEIQSKLGIEDENGVFIVDAAFNVRVVKSEPDLLKGVMTIDQGEKFTRDDFIQMQSVPGR